MSQKKYPDLNAIGPALLVLIGGFGLLVLLSVLGISDGPSFIALLVLPVVVYLLASGRLREFSGPGGWGAKFVDVAQQPVLADIPGIERKTDFERVEIFDKSSYPELLNRLSSGRFSKPIALVMQVGRHFYNVVVLKKYLLTLIAHDKNCVVLVVDRDGSFLFTTSALQLSSLISISRSNFGTKFLEHLSEGDVKKIQMLLDVATLYIGSDTTNGEALRLMLSSGLDEMIALDERRHPIGIIRREDVLAKIIIQPDFVDQSEL